MALTKHRLVEQFQNEMGFPRNRSVDVTENIFKIVKDAREAGDDVLLSGFGKFSVNDKKERKGRNPSSGEVAILPARRVVTFKCSATLRGKVNGK